MTTAHPLDDAPLSRFHKKLALYASGGPFLDGYVLSIIGVALVQISPKFNMSSAEEGLVGASALVGIFLGAFLGGWLTDKFGRQVLFTIDLAAIIVCSIAPVLRRRRLLADHPATADRHGRRRRLPDCHLATG